MVAISRRTISTHSTKLDDRNACLDASKSELFLNDATHYVFQTMLLCVLYNVVTTKLVQHYCSSWLRQRKIRTEYSTRVREEYSSTLNTHKEEKKPKMKLFCFLSLSLFLGEEKASGLRDLSLPFGAPKSAAATLRELASAAERHGLLYTLFP